MVSKRTVNILTTLLEHDMHVSAIFNRARVRATMQYYVNYRRRLNNERNIYQVGIPKDVLDETFNSPELKNMSLPEHLKVVKALRVKYQYPGVTEEDIGTKFLSDRSLSLTEIIVAVEGLDLTRLYPIKNDYENRFITARCANCKDKRRGYDFTLNYSIYSFHCRRFASLPEILAGKLYPKGRSSWRAYMYSSHFEGYEEAVKQAKSLTASFSRTMKNLRLRNLVKKTDSGSNKGSRYLITEHDKESLTILNTVEKKNIINPKHWWDKIYDKKS